MFLNNNALTCIKEGTINLLKEKKWKRKETKTKKRNKQVMIIWKVRYKFKRKVENEKKEKEKKTFINGLKKINNFVKNNKKYFFHLSTSIMRWRINNKLIAFWYFGYDQSEVSPFISLTSIV